MYRLTLTREERRAIDWIGHRYAHGDDLFDILIDFVVGEQEWCELGDMTFEIPESSVEGIRRIIDEDNLACFSTSLVEKLMVFFA